MPPSAQLPTESSPLIDKRSIVARSGWFGPIPRIYFTCILNAVAFAFTQTSLMYVLRMMTCDDYYQGHEYSGSGDRCALPRIEGDTARNIAIVSSATSFFCASLVRLI